MDNISDMLKGLDSLKVQTMLTSARGREIAEKMRGMSKEQVLDVLTNQYGMSQHQLQQLANHPDVKNLLKGL
jgi:hypothetical protein